MKIGKSDEELAAADGHSSRLYSACKRLAWISLAMIVPAFGALGLVTLGPDHHRGALLLAALVVALCLGGFLWGILWPRTYPDRRKTGQWTLCLLGCLLLFVPTMVLSIGSVVLSQHGDVAFDYRTESFEPAGYPAARFLAREYIPPTATEIRLKGNTGIGWALGGYAAFSCNVPEKDFLAFAKEHLYELRAEEGEAPMGFLSLYTRLYPDDPHRVPERYWIHRLPYPNGGGVTLVFDRDDQRLLGSFSTN